MQVAAPERMTTAACSESDAFDLATAEGEGLGNGLARISHTGRPRARNAGWHLTFAAPYKSLFQRSFLPAVSKAAKSKVTASIGALMAPHEKFRPVLLSFGYYVTLPIILFNLSLTVSYV